MIRFTSQDCPPIFLIGGSTTLGIASGYGLAISPFVCPEQRLYLVPYLAPPLAAASIQKATPSDTLAGAAESTASSPHVLEARELDRLLPSEGVTGVASTVNSSRKAVTLESTKRLMTEYRAILTRAWSGAPDLATAYPSSGFYGHLQPPETKLPALLDRVAPLGPAQGLTTSLADVLKSTQPAQCPVLFLTLCVDEMQGLVETTDPEALKSAGGDVGVVAARMAANQLAALLEQIEMYIRDAPSSPSPSSSAGSAPLTLVVVADDICRAGLLRYQDDLHARVARLKVRLLYTWVSELTPPALDSGLTDASVSCAANGLANGLTSLCASVTVGLQRYLELPRMSPTPFVPVDLAMNVALLDVIVARTGPAAAVTSLLETRAVGQATVGALSIGSASGQTLVWGMLAEYLMDYVLRYAARIQAVFPPLTTKAASVSSGSSSAPAPGLTLLEPRPALQFSPSVDNWFKALYGVGTTTPVPCLLDRQSQQRQDALLSPASPLSQPKRDVLKRVAQRSQQVQARYVAALDAVAKAAAGERPAKGLSTPALIATAVLVPGGTVLAAAQLAKNRANAAASKQKKKATTVADTKAAATSLFAFDVRRYERLLARLAQAHTLAPYLQFVSLVQVDWGMYIRLITRGVLANLARFVVEAPESEKIAFPAPTRLFVNDITFHGPDRAPSQPIMHRRLWSNADWFGRGGMGPTGVLGTMTPGMTSRRLATILEQPTIRDLLSTVAANEGVPVDEVEKRAKTILLRLGDTQSQTASRVVGLLVRQLFFKVYDRVNVTRNGFAFLRRLYSRPRTHIVLVPLHRSYSDFLVMTYMLACMSLPTPHIVAGEDFLGMGKFAELLRGGGAFFMRRSFRGDPIYGRLFREYVRQLIYHGQSIEFFIEGTRSRTNKTMVPKLGILKFIADALYEGASTDIDDVLIVPVSLSYDELLEAGVYAKELLGIPKPRESVPNMIKAGISLDRLYGSINIAFGDPISLRDFRANPMQCPSEFTPKPATASSRKTAKPLSSVAAATPVTSLLAPKPLPKPAFSTPAPLLTALGWRVAYELQKNIVITPSSLVAAVLECFGTRSAPSAVSAMPSLSMERMVALVAWLREHLRVRQAHLSRELATWAPQAVVKGGLDRLVRFVRTRPAPPSTPPGQDEAPAAPRVIAYEPPTVTSRLGVNMSANQLIHLFIDEAVISLIAAVDGSGVVGRADRLVQPDALSAQAQFLTTALSREFPNFSASTPCSFDSWLAFAVGRVQRFGHLEVGASAALTQTEDTTTATPAAEMTSAKAAMAIAIPATRLFRFHLQLILPHIEAAYYTATALQILLTSRNSSSSGAGEAGEAAGVPSRWLLQAVHQAAMELCGEEVPRRRQSGAASATSNSNSDSSPGQSTPTSVVSASAASNPKQRALQYTNTTCNKEVLVHYMEAMIDVGAVALQAQPSAFGGQVYRLRDADKLTAMVAGLERYVKGGETAVGANDEPAMALLCGDAAASMMKMVVWKHYNEIASKPKL